jgi:hypothetical protein
MGIEDFKRWHWIAIGLFVGVVLTYTRLQLTPDEAAGARAGKSVPEIVGLLMTPKTDKGYTLVYDLAIYPVQSVVDVQGVTRRTSFVSGMYWEKQPSGKALPKPFQLTTEVPFKPPGTRTPPSETYTFRQYVDELRTKNPDIRYSYAWWTLPPAVAGLWGGGSLLLIGGVWPMVVNLMIGAGFGRPKKAASEYDLDRFGKSAEDDDSLGRPTGKLVTQADHDKLTALQESLERNLAASGVTETPAADTPVSRPATVRKLEGGPLELAAGVSAAEQAAREFKGEFYPVARPAGHKDDEPTP